MGLRVRACQVWPDDHPGSQQNGGRQSSQPSGQQSSQPSGQQSAGGSPEPAELPGFVGSSFSPIVAEVAGRCLTACYGRPPVPEAEAAGAAIVLLSRYGDVATAQAVAGAVDAGTRVGPLLFFQSVPNAVAGWLAARWGLAGPVVCLSPAGDPVHQAMRAIRLLVAAGDADRALLVLVEQDPTGNGPDHALAALVDSARSRP
jgi:hypothetical protein